MGSPDHAIRSKPPSMSEPFCGRDVSLCLVDSDFASRAPRIPPVGLQRSSPGIRRPFEYPFPRNARHRPTRTVGLPPWSILSLSCPILLLYCERAFASLGRKPLPPSEKKTGVLHAMFPSKICAMQTRISFGKDRAGLRKSRRRECSRGSVDCAKKSEPRFFPAAVGPDGQSSIVRTVVRRPEKDRI